MCGRFTLQSPADLIRDLFDVEQMPELPARYNVAPTQDVACVVENDGREIVFQRWGLIPFFAKDMAIGNRMINARAETIAEKPSFRAAFKRRRCLILADGFYEWKKTDEGKVPCHITLKDKSCFGFAGLWESWKSPEQETVRSCTIITTESNETLKPLHHRMPVILKAEDHDTWLDQGLEERDVLQSLLVPYANDAMSFREVSKKVNSPRNEGADLLL